MIPPLTRQQVAELTGTILYTVSRTSSQWEADGVLRSGRRRLETLSRTDDDESHSSTDLAPAQSARAERCVPWS
ncbi:MAG: helix-turn-helix domain-containing protein [Luteitalea sp.]|nr:helix-turn-helix domain-containing protein [Luteitalea sp.]